MVMRVFSPSQPDPHDTLWDRQGYTVRPYLKKKNVKVGVHVQNRSNGSN